MLPAALVQVDKDIEELFPFGRRVNAMNRHVAGLKIAFVSLSQSIAMLLGKLHQEFFPGRRQHNSPSVHWLTDVDDASLLTQMLEYALTGLSEPSTPINSRRSQRSLVSPESELQFSSHLEIASATESSAPSRQRMLK